MLAVISRCKDVAAFKAAAKQQQRSFNQTNCILELLFPTACRAKAGFKDTAGFKATAKKQLAPLRAAVAKIAALSVTVGRTMSALWTSSMTAAFGGAGAAGVNRRASALHVGSPMMTG
jgi:hypothetical protein